MNNTTIKREEMSMVIGEEHYIRKGELKSSLVPTIVGQATCTCDIFNIKIETVRSGQVGSIKWE